MRGKKQAQRQFVAMIDVNARIPQGYPIREIKRLSDEVFGRLSPRFDAMYSEIGRRTGVARILGHNFSGLVAWWLWRTIYLLKLPRAEKKLRVAIDWTLDVFFSKDLVQFLHERSAAISDAPPANPPGVTSPAPAPAARRGP
jgi:hypothetical protein